MSVTYRNFINGEWVVASTGETYERENPANPSEKVFEAQASGPEDVNRAVDAAEAAFASWSRLTPAARGEYLRKAADILESSADEIAQILTREMGKTIGEAKGEVLRAVAIFRYYAGEGLRPLGENIPSMTPGNLLYTTRVPLGVVGLITPWNFPIAIPAWKMAPALAYGNTVVLKPAGYTVGTAVKLFEALEKAGLPPGVANLVTGSGSKVGNPLAENRKVKAISFTGSNQVGMHIAAKLIQRGGKYQLEMGGKNPAIVAADADLDQAVELVVSGAMRHTGQKCTATSRAIVERPILEEFTRRVVERCRSLKVGPGLDPSVYMGPLVSKEQQRTVLDYIEIGKKEGARLLCGGDVPEGLDGYYVNPTVFDQVTPRMRIAQEEIFGPVLAIIPADSLQDAIRIANDVEFGLSASLFTRDINKALTFINEIEAGMVRINGETAGVELQAPFGGMKASSSHSREQGRAALEFFTSVKTITVSPAGM